MLCCFFFHSLITGSGQGQPGLKKRGLTDALPHLVALKSTVEEISEAELTITAKISFYFFLIKLFIFIFFKEEFCPKQVLLP